MKILDRYIGRTVFTHVLGTLAVLLSMYFLSLFVDETEFVGKGHYTYLQAFLFTLMLVPRQAYELFPMVTLVGSMLGLGALAGSSELTVIRAAGVSVRRIMLSVFKVGLLMMAVVILLGEVIGPPLEKFARLERAEALAQGITVNMEDGLWARDGNTFINIRQLLTDGSAQDIYLYRFGENQALRQLIYAKRGHYDEQGWQLYQVREDLIEPDRVVTRQRAEMPWKTSLTPEVIKVVAVPPENLSMVDLYEYMRFLKRNGQDSRHYELSLWVRVMAPLACAGMMLLAVPFVFGSLRSVGIGQRIVVGAVIGIGFYMFNGIFNRVGLVYDMPPILAAVAPTVTVYLLLLFLMRRVH